MSLRMGLNQWTYKVKYSNSNILRRSNWYKETKVPQSVKHA